MSANARSNNLSVHTIGVDLMGADVPPSHILEAAVNLPANFHSDTSFVFFATHEHSLLLQNAIKNLPNSRFVLSQDFVRMDENPLSVIREKQQTSLLAGITALKNEELSCFVSCANTGALVAIARLLLDTFTGISKPALSCRVPTQKGDVVMLDVGGNVEATAEMLLQFAHLGAAYCKTLYGIDQPKVALLNIGQEALKGTQELKSARDLFSEAQSFDFVGNKEPCDVFAGAADVFVTNGFSGNLFIKTSEAASRHILHALHKQHPTISFSDIMAGDAGAELLGVKSLVVKCHGAASAQAIQQSLIHTKQLLKINAIEKMCSYFVA